MTFVYSSGYPVGVGLLDSMKLACSPSVITRASGLAIGSMWPCSSQGAEPPNQVRWSVPGPRRTADRAEARPAHRPGPPRPARPRPGGERPDQRHGKYQRAAAGIPAQVRHLGPGKGNGQARRLHRPHGGSRVFLRLRSPWQRGTSENTSGLLRQYFPKCTGLSLHSRAELDMAAMELCGMPRKTLGWKKPIEVYAEMLEEDRGAITG